MLLAGRAQVHVGIDERREQVAPLALDDLAAVGCGQGAGGGDLGDLAAAHEDVAAAVEARARIERVDVAQQQVGGPRGRADEADAGGAVGGWLVDAHASWGSVGRGALRSSRAPASTS